MTVMVDRIALAKRFSPWEPSPDAHLVETYVYYDIPRLGVISEHGGLYLFRCVEGYADEVHVWAYAPIGTSDVDSLNQAKGSPEFWELVRNLSFHAPMSFAVANDSEGVLDCWDDFDLGGGIESVMDTDSILKRIIEAAGHSEKVPPDVQELLREMSAA
jgi:hypothetical protein